MATLCCAGYWVVGAALVTPPHEPVDVVSGRPLSLTPPPLPSAWYGGSRWLQHYIRLWVEAFKPPSEQRTVLYSALVQHHCRRGSPAGAIFGNVSLLFVRTTRTHARGDGTRASAGVDGAGASYGNGSEEARRRSSRGSDSDSVPHPLSGPSLVWQEPCVAPMTGE